MSKDIIQTWPNQDWLLKKGPLREFHPTNIPAPETERFRNWKRIVDACKRHIEISKERDPYTNSALVNLGSEETAEGLFLLGQETGVRHTVEIDETPESNETLFVIEPWCSRFEGARFRVQRWDNVVETHIVGDRMTFDMARHNLDNSELKTLACLLEGGSLPDTGGEEKLEFGKNVRFFASLRNVLKIPFGRR